MWAVEQCSFQWGYCDTIAYFDREEDAKECVALLSGQRKQFDYDVLEKEPPVINPEKEDWAAL